MSQKSKEGLEHAPLLSTNSQDSGSPHNVPPEVAAAIVGQYGAANVNAATSAYMAGYYPDPASAAAAAAMYGQPPGSAPAGFYYTGYPPPPPQGHHSMPSQSPGQNMYPPQAYMYPPAAFSPSQTVRPPRSQRRKGAPVSSSPSGARQVYMEGGVPVAGLPTAPVLSLSSDEEQPLKDGSYIPAMREVYSDEQPLLPFGGNAATIGSGYGSTGTKTTTSASAGSGHSPKIYNAPPPRNKVSSSRNKNGLPLTRTNSSGDFRHPLKGSGSNTKVGSHRRINSDVPLRGVRPRLGSSDELPPMGHRRVLSSTNSSNANRGRTFSGGQVKKPTHRRGDSASSLLSNMSASSVVSNIAKSEFFGGVDEFGRVQMHFPFEAIKLVMVDPEKPALRPGHLYLDGRMGDFEKFEEYHQAGDMVIAPQWESFERSSGRKTSLPRPNYILAVNDSVYQRVIGEISDSQTMPCGLFFCGHHEDVAHPSILIAVAIVILFLAGLAYASYCTGETS